MIKLILAIDDAGGIGKDNTLPWPHNSTDLKRFKRLTSGHVVVMGSSTWNAEGMPKPLPNRINYVFSNTMTEAPGATIVNGGAEQVIKQIALDNLYDDIWIIGGANLIKQCWHLCEEKHITRITGDYDCDTKINMDKLKQEELVTYSKHPDVTFEIYKTKVNQ